MRERILLVTKKDFEIKSIRGSGPGGQHRNKVATGIRMVHKASGATGEATDDKSRENNLQNAFKRLRETQEWKRWFKITVAEAMGRPSIESLVDDAMKPGNITTQVRVDDAWLTVDPEQLND